MLTENECDEVQPTWPPTVAVDPPRPDLKSRLNDGYAIWVTEENRAYRWNLQSRSWRPEGRF